MGMQNDDDIGSNREFYPQNLPREDDAPECHGMAQISGQSTFPNLLSYQFRGVLELSLNPSSPVLSAQVF